MKLIKKIMCMSIVLCVLTSFVYAFGFTNGIDLPRGIEIQKNIEKEYGLNIILPQNIDIYMNINDSMVVIESSLSRFPDGLIKEITDFYLKKGIKTNIIINKTRNNFKKQPVEYKMLNSSANITINILTNDFYGMTDIVSLDGITLGISRYICDYLYDVYGYDALKLEFDKLNNGLEYGTWSEGYDKAFVNQYSSANLDEDISGLIWFAENYPEKILNISLGKNEIIHSKIEFLSKVFKESFNSVTEESKLWLNTIPGKPDAWAADEIELMLKLGLIPKEFEGKYESYISREEFCTLALNLVKVKIGKDKFYDYFDIQKPQKSLNIDPLNGEIIVSDMISDIFYDISFCSNKEDIYEAYKIGLIYDLNNGKFDPQANITRLEVAEIATSICEKFGIDITKYNEINFDDITELGDFEKPYMYFALDKGILKGYDNMVKPNEYCTYQEAYIMLNRVYVLKD